MSTQVGRGHILGITVGTIVITDNDGGTTLTGTATYDERSLQVSHNGNISKIKNESGDTCALIATDDVLECRFNFIPYGTTVAAATAAAAGPDLLASAAITGMPIFKMGPFADALNTDSGSTQPWFYEGGWDVNGSADGEPWSISFSLFRYPNITSAAAIS